MKNLHKQIATAKDSTIHSVNHLETLGNVEEVRIIREALKR